MPALKTKRRECVYVIGAGFSAGLGYPLTSDLLFRIWKELDKGLRSRLSRVVKFHHPGFNEQLFTTYPNVEELLSEMLVNEKLFEASRQSESNFTLETLQLVQRDLLLRIAEWFHELSEDIDWKHKGGSWLRKFRNRVYRENAALISFNWDLVLDRLLFDGNLNAESYWPQADGGPVLLKPHGSLNWFEHNQGKHIKGDKRIEIFSQDGQRAHAFRLFRAPVSNNDRIYTPLIVPPVHLKEFDKPIFKRLWQESVSVLSTAKNVVFLGYSMPANDLHVQFIMRCGFYNQIKGIPQGHGQPRTASTGAAKVVIVNPDQAAARRISAVVGDASRCEWVSSPVSEWVTKLAGK
jgi:hypothetical protein